MDPISAAAITTLLVDYGRHLAGVARDIVDEGIAKGLRAIWEKVRNRFSGDAHASAAFERLAEQPDNTRRQASVEDFLDELMQADAEFAASLAELAAQIKPGSCDNIRIGDAGAVAIGGGVDISGAGFAAGRDIKLRRT